jgi:hypothetical protein
VHLIGRRVQVLLRSSELVVTPKPPKSPGSL